MKDFDKETMLAWSWAMEHPYLYAMIEMSKPIAIAIVCLGVIKGIMGILFKMYINTKGSKRKSSF